MCIKYGYSEQCIWDISTEPKIASCLGTSVCIRINILCNSHNQTTSFVKYLLAG